MRQPPDTTFMPDGETHVARRRLSLGVCNIIETVDFVSMLQRLQNGLKHKLLLLRARKQCCNANAACLAEQSAHKNKEQERRSCFRAQEKRQQSSRSWLKVPEVKILTWQLAVPSTLSTFLWEESSTDLAKRSNISCQACHLQILQHSSPSSLFSPWGPGFLCKQKH